MGVIMAAINASSWINEKMMEWLGKFLQVSNYIKGAS